MTLFVFVVEMFTPQYSKYGGGGGEGKVFPSLPTKFLKSIVRTNVLIQAI